MCGLAGFWSVGHNASHHSGGEEIVGRMTTAIAHRGPDDTGLWSDKDAGLFLGHRRLAILDVSAAGHQPMQSHCGRYVLAYNGEIYNHLQIRKDIESMSGGIQWRGTSDTETILAACSAWGFEKTLDKLNGMFAIVLWDRQENSLHLARDRMGEKPLYYGCIGNTLIFGSELKALRQHPSWQGEIDRDALAQYLRLTHVAPPSSIFKNIRKLLPGHTLSFTGDFSSEVEQQCYWSLSAIASDSKRVYAEANKSSLIDELETRLAKSVGSRMIADVPLGAFLSGGYDSSLVVAMMCKHSSQSVKTFTIGFEDESFNEAPHAKKVAEHLGTDHTELYLSSKDALDIIPLLPQFWDEPFADSSQIPTYLVSRLTRDSVTVALSGDGGDELFGGYSRYIKAQQVWAKLNRFPSPVRELLAGISGVVARPMADQLAKLDSALTSKLVQNLDRANELGGLFASGSRDQLYSHMVCHWEDPESIVIGSRETASLMADPSSLPPLPDYLDRMMLLDMLAYLPNDILTKVDRASMAVSLESRAPLLDHELVEFAWTISPELRIHNGVGKWPLREVTHRYLPEELMHRPKMGFGIPIHGFLRNELRSWADDLLSVDRLERQGYFNAEKIAQMWKEHTDGRRDWAYKLWDVLMFQSWLESDMVSGST